MRICQYAIISIKSCKKSIERIVKLKSILKRITNYKIIGRNDVNIENLSQSSKKIAKNMLFFCINGTKTNGSLYISEAIKNGAIAIVLQKKSKKEHTKNLKIYKDITFVFVDDVRKAMAIMSSNFFCNPEKKLKIVGITGTNGKTSCSFLIAELLRKSKKKVGVIGTSGIWIGDKKLESNMTTPDSIELFELFSKMVKARVKYCIMEVSAHAIYLNKVYGINFAVKALTNVTSDHLDFFKTKQKYASTKEKFFESDSFAIFNVDDRIGKKLSKKYQKSVAFGLKNADFLIKNINCQLGNTIFELKFGKKIFHIKSNLTGKFNVYNITLSLAVLSALGFNIKNCVANICKIKKLDGRFDIVENGQNLSIIIDYAHTYDALKNLLVTLKSVSLNKNIIVFGCPGERDTKKRFQMGKLAGEFCDVVILTADNPATENPKRIMFEMSEGARQTNCRCYLIENRKKAVEKAIELSKKYENANILIVGKGTENYQIVGDKHKRYSDYETVKNILSSSNFCQK